MKKLAIKCILLTFLVLAFAFYGYTENRSLEIEHLSVSISELPENLSGLTIVHLSDIHFPNTGIDVEKLIAETKKAQPDLIFLTGDLIQRTAEISETPLVELVSAMVAIAPTYSVSGNQEVSSGQLEEWNEVMVRSGANLLENDIDLITVSGEEIAIAGVEDWHMTTDINNLLSLDHVPILLLAHRPEYFDSYATDNPTLQPDITFSGHAHGGQIRLPLIGPIFAPGQGFFPQYTSGVYSSENHSEQKLVVSRGIGNSIFPFRMGNKPHFIVVTLTNS